jgi:hypothetical protein
MILFVQRKHSKLIGHECRSTPSPEWAKIALEISIHTGKEETTLIFPALDAGPISHTLD